MSASQFISLLESKGLLDPEIISELHRQVEQSKVRVTPEAIARLLVDNGQLTRFQATKLVTELNESLGKSGEPTAKNATTKSDNDSVEDLLPDDDLIEVTEVEADVVKEASVDSTEIASVEIVEVAQPKKQRRELSVDSQLNAPPPAKFVRKAEVKKSPWESFGIIGLTFILLLLMIPFVGLFIWFRQGSAEESYKVAEEAFKSREYDRSAKLFGDFANNYSSDSKASGARVKAALSKIRQDAEKSADPEVGLKTAQEILPTISGEASLNELRGEVADTLLKIAERFIVRADNTANVEERKKLVTLMNAEMELVRDSRYIGSQERTQNELRIRRIEEGQQRVTRDIQRAEDLAATIVAMTDSIASKDVMKTYDLRRELIRKYPQLETEAKIKELLKEATVLQKDLVKSAKVSPTVSTDPVETSVKASAILVSRKEVGKVGDGRSTVFLRVKGSLVAVDGNDGQLLWRQHIGRDWTGEPRSISGTNDSDALVSFPERGTVQRLSGKDGSLVWEAKFPGRIVEPSLDGEDLFVATTKGELYCIDVASGQSRWGKAIPQSIEVGIGGAATRRKRYVVGNHSNLYVFSRGNGQCDEVLYLGHNAGTIAVPPIWVLNQLIIFENAGPDYSLMRVFTTNDDGVALEVAQNAVRFRGHVVVEPQVDGRRLAVVTNLGEIAILDVEPSNPKEKVTKLVNKVANEASPKVAWPLLVGNNLWIASDRLALYQIQVSRSQLNPMWQREDGDQFVSRPMKLNEAMIHARVVRGNSGIRVSAVSQATGDPIWESDIGTPVTSLSTDGKSFTVLTSQGATYVLDPKSFQSKQANAPVENLGRNQRSMLFENPVTLKDNRIALLNRAQGNQLLLLDPTRKSGQSTKLLALDLSESFPSADAVGVGSSIVIPLENAQLAMLDPDKGKMIGTPFQPTIQAGEKPKWLNPVLMSDQQTVIVADQAKNIYKLATGKQLRTLLSSPIERGLKGRLEIINDVVVGTHPGASGDVLDFYDSAELRKSASLQIEGRFAWGPFVVGNGQEAVGLAFSDIEGLLAFDSTGKKLWNTPVQGSVLTGAPVSVESDCIIATTTGQLLRFSLADGRLTAKASTGEPISGTPLALPKGLLVPCDEGCVLTVAMPTTLDSNEAGSGQ